MPSRERGTTLPAWWLGGTTAVALATGVAAAWFLMSGRCDTGGVYLLVSVLTLRCPPSIWNDDERVELPRRQLHCALLGVCVLGVFFRTYQIAPPGLWGDEAVNGLRAFDILDGKVHSPFELVEQPLTQFHALCNFPIAAAFWAFGAGPTALRLPGIMAGILEVPLLFGTFSPLFGSATALAATTFFASSPWQISHAKGLTQIEFGRFFLLLAMCLVVRGVAGKRRWLIPLAGVPLAGCLYTYHAAKLAPLVPAIFLLATLRTAPRRRALALWSAALLLVFVCSSIPAVFSYLQHPGALTGRVETVALWRTASRAHSLAPLWDSLWRTLMIFQYQQGPTYHWFGIGTDPALNLILAFLFVHGLVQSLRHCTTPRHGLLLGWFVVGLVPGLLSTGAPRAYRIFLASPPLYVWAALPLARLYHAATRALTPRRWLQGVVMCIVVAVPVVDFNYYFYRLYTNREFRWYQVTRLVDMADTLKALGPGWTGYVIADSFAAGYETLAFLSRAWSLTFQDVRSLADVLPIRDEPDGGVLFIVDRGNEAVSPLVESLYPSVKADVRTDPPVRTWWFDRWVPLAAPEEPARPTVTFLAVPRRTVDSIRGVTVMFLTADGEPVVTRVDPRLQINGVGDLPHGPGTPAQVKWSGALYAPIDGTYQLALQSAAEARVWIDERLVLSQIAHLATVSLAQGLHRIAAEATVTDSPTFHLQWQPPDGAMGEIPASLLFRSGDIHGLLAAYDLGERTLHRIEPYPYYNFFHATFPGPFAGHWRGRLHVPAPGGYQLAVSSNGATSIAIDGQPMPVESTVSAGDHDLAIDITDVRTALRLQVFWQKPAGGRRLIPPSAFTPPFAGFAQESQPSPCPNPSPVSDRSGEQ
jgi:hypothetical protein